MTKAASNCAHEAFATQAKVARLEDSGKFLLELLVQCTECNLPFHFVGVERGLSFVGPMAGVDLLELRIPIAPGSQFPGQEYVPTKGN